MRLSYKAWAYRLCNTPGVGQNFQDHFAVGCMWEYQEPLAPRNNGGEATFSEEQPWS